MSTFGAQIGPPNGNLSLGLRRDSEAHSGRPERLVFAAGAAEALHCGLAGRRRGRGRTPSPRSRSREAPASAAPPGTGDGARKSSARLRRDRRRRQPDLLSRLPPRPRYTRETVHCRDKRPPQHLARRPHYRACENESSASIGESWRAAAHALFAPRNPDPITIVSNTDR